MLKRSILLTASPDSLIDALSGEVSTVVQKPFEPKQLIDAVRPHERVMTFTVLTATTPSSRLHADDAVPAWARGAFRFDHAHER